MMPSRNNLPFSFSRRQALLHGLLLGTSAVLPSLGVASSAKVRNHTSKVGSLQTKLNALVQAMRKKKHIKSSEITSWSVYDFKTGKKLVSINENRLMQAASMIKPFVALAYFYLNKQNPRNYPYRTYHKKLMQDMLVHSSNESTNKLMKLCRGPKSVKRLCQLSSHNRFANLHFVEYIPKGGKTYRNKISAHDYSRLLYALWNSQLVGSKEILRMMGIENHDRIRGDTIPSSVKIYDKTGSTSMLCGEMGIVNIGNHQHAYTFIGIIQGSKKSSNYGRWISGRSDAMREVSALVYHHMKGTY